MGVVGTRVLENHNRNYFYEPERFGEFQERFNNQLRVKGSKQAILSTYRSTPLQSYLPGYQKLGALGRKVLVVWGKEDRAFPFENSNKAQNALKSVTFVPVAKAGHLPQYETPDQVIPPLLDYLKT